MLALYANSLLLNFLLALPRRLIIMDDFEVQFDASTRDKKGLEVSPYRYNVSAKPLFGHAALIVGFDNDKYTWWAHCSLPHCFCVASTKSQSTHLRSCLPYGQHRPV